MGRPEPSPPAVHHVWATRQERFAWAMYDFANSGYTTVVLTTVFNVYFVTVVAGRWSAGVALFAWTAAVALANLLVLVSAPVIGAMADDRGAKKRFLAMAAACCVVATALLATVGPGAIAWGVFLLVVSNVAFGVGEDLIAAFLPELAPAAEQGRLSGYGWSLGYVGSLLTLALSLLIVRQASPQASVPLVMLLVAGTFALATLPTFLLLRERAPRRALAFSRAYVHEGLQRFRDTLAHARQFRDLFRFLTALAVYQCGVNTVVVVAAVYARQVMGFAQEGIIGLILVVNVTAAIGALAFGRLQDRWGSVPTLAVTLAVWILAALTVFASRSVPAFWLAANLVGVAMGSSQSAGRALVAQFSPPSRAGEFLGLWGTAVKLAAVVGPPSYGLVNLLAGGNQRLAMLATTLYFIAGLGLLLRVDERRGRAAAQDVAEVRQAA